MEVFMMKKSLVALFLVLLAVAFIAPAMADEMILTCTKCGAKVTVPENQQEIFKKKNIKTCVCKECTAKKAQPRGGVKHQPTNQDIPQKGGEGSCRPDNKKK